MQLTPFAATKSQVPPAPDALTARSYAPTPRGEPSPARSYAPPPVDQPTPARAYAPTAHDIREHMHLVHKVVGMMLRRLPRSVQRDDLIAAGTLGLLDALRRNAGDLGSPAFECYARIRIRGAMIDALRQLDWAPRRARNADADARAPMTIVGFDEEADPMATADARGQDPESLVERLELRRAIDEAMAKLPARDRRVLELRYVHAVPSKDIASMLGVSEARVSQLHARAVSALRSMLAALDPRAVTCTA